MKANSTSKKFLLHKISRLIRKTSSRLLIRTISREPFEKTVKNMTKMTKFWKILESLEIDQDWSRKLPEALKTDFKRISSHRKPSEAISKNPEISRKMEPTGSQIMEIRACRYAAAQCQNRLKSLFSWCEALFKKYDVTFWPNTGKAGNRVLSRTWSFSHFGKSSIGVNESKFNIEEISPS